MSTNISKKKRDDLLDKIKQIRAFIAAAPQDENTGNLLSYLSELEKDVNGKKYLDTHGLKGGIVRNDATTDELCICMEHYSDDIGSDDWVLLENILG